MNKINIQLTGILVMLLLLTSGYAGENNNSISVSSRTSSTMKLAETLAPGKANGIIIEDTQWINYVIEANPSEPLKSISAYIASGNIPPGIEIYAEASHDNGLGRGKPGRPVGKIKLSNVPTVLINEIGTSNTGNGKFHGHRITLYTVVTDYTRVQSGDYNFYIQYLVN